MLLTCYEITVLESAGKRKTDENIGLVFGCPMLRNHRFRNRRKNSAEIVVMIF
jgi:hypothetical protein